MRSGKPGQMDRKELLFPGRGTRYLQGRNGARFIEQYRIANCVCVAPKKTNSPLVIDSNAVLAFPIVFKPFKAISRQG